MKALRIETGGGFDKGRVWGPGALLIPAANNMIVYQGIILDLPKIYFGYQGLEGKDFIKKAEVDIPDELVNELLALGNAQAKIEARAEELFKLFKGFPIEALRKRA